MGEDSLNGKRASIAVSPQMYSTQAQTSSELVGFVGGSFDREAAI
jgi:hypothetical protein